MRTIILGLLVSCLLGFWTQCTKAGELTDYSVSILDDIDNSKYDFLIITINDHIYESRIESNKLEEKAPVILEYLLKLENIN